MYENDDIKVMNAFSTDVKNRYLKPTEHLYAMDTGTHYVCGKDGAPQALVTASPSAQGVGIGDRTGGRITAGSKSMGVVRDALLDISWLKPIHVDILQPELFTAMGSVSSSGAGTVATYDATTSARGLGSIKFVAAAATANQRTLLQLPQPVEAGVRSKYRAGGIVHYRMRCSDWTKIDHLYISLLDGSDPTHQWQGRIVENTNVSMYGCTNPNTAAAWNGVFRNFVMQSREFYKIGSPAAWGTDARYLDITHLYIDISCSAAVTLWIDQIYSPDWPVGFVVPISDGCYESARNLFAQDFPPRGWGWGVSVNRQNTGGIYPSTADIAAQAALGADVFPHGHILSGTSPAALTGGVSEATFLQVHAQQRRALLSAGPSPAGMRWFQWLENTGRLTTNDTATTLKKLGYAAGRADTSDAEFGYDPYDGTGKTAVRNWRAQAPIPKNGRFNRSILAAPSGRDNNGVVNLDDYWYYNGINTVASEVNYVAMSGQCVHTYDHEIKDPAPGVFDDSLKAYKQRLEHWESLSKDGKILVIKPSDMERITYWRDDDVFVRWDGEWVYRHDPTQIAF